MESFDLKNNYNEIKGNLSIQNIQGFPKKQTPIKNLFHLLSPCIHPVYHTIAIAQNKISNMPK